MQIYPRRKITLAWRRPSTPSPSGCTSSFWRRVTARDVSPLFSLLSNKFSGNLCSPRRTSHTHLRVYTGWEWREGKSLHFLPVCLFPSTRPPRRNKRSAGGIFLDGSHCDTGPRGCRKRRPSTVLSYLFPVPAVVSTNTAKLLATTLDRDPTRAKMTLLLLLLPLLPPFFAVFAKYEIFSRLSFFGNFNLWFFDGFL